jgi:hypothetical protein
VQVRDFASQIIHLSKRISEQRDQFGNVTCYISASVDEVTTHGALALGLIEQVLKDLLKFISLGSKSYGN